MYAFPVAAGASPPALDQPDRVLIGPRRGEQAARARVERAQLRERAERRETIATGLSHIDGLAQGLGRGSAIAIGEAPTENR